MSFGLHQNLLKDLSMHVGEAEVSALQAVGELSILEAEFVALTVNLTALADSNNPQQRLLFFF